LVKALQQGVAETKKGKPYPVEAADRTIGKRAGPTWHRSFQMARGQVFDYTFRHSDCVGIDGLRVREARYRIVLRNGE
jgi:hypothetical protein